VFPTSGTLQIGATLQLTATVWDAAGNVLTGRVITWTTGAGSIATVNQSGLVTAVATGTVTITASSEGRTGSASITVPTVSVATVTVSPGSGSITAGSTIQLSATTRDPAGNVLTGRTITWSSSATGIATVNSSGLVTGVSPGSATITATSEGKTGTATITVTQVPVASVTVTPGSGTVAIGSSLQLSATTRDAGGNILTGRTIVWSTSAGGIATVNSSGLVTGVAAGTATITATSEGKSGTASITVPQVPVATVTVSPASGSVATGSTLQLSATTRDAAGNVLTGRTVIWSSSATGIATVSSSGLVTGVAAGSATITATSEGKSGSSAITVTSSGGGGVVFVGAGDISRCDNNFDEATALLLDAIPGTVFTTGDNVYEQGTVSEWTNCYGPTWGRHKARTRPSPGNHEYLTSGTSATTYFNYYGANAGPAGLGYYSYNLGDWHIISLNTNINTSPGSPQEQWLRADLAANTKACTLAYWHYPRYSSGPQGDMLHSQPLWQALYDYNADVVLAGHDHNYQRFAPMNATGGADPARGLRSFVVGTGGALTALFSLPPRANTEAYHRETHGVLKLTLNTNSYSWQFIPIAGQTYTDSGTASCH
jgi:uncharacterized protein YjdB